MVRREGQVIHIYIGSDVTRDVVRAEWHVADDVEATDVGKNKELNVGAQGQALLAPLVDWALGKLTNGDRVVTRPVAP